MVVGGAARQNAPATSSQAHVRSGRVADRWRGSALSRFLEGESLSRPQTELMVPTWHTEKANLGKENFDARGKQELLH